uniref:Uncharacterized protein n=1 Tax=Ananas comosus var. bracteatus TaxID=296719 RepID=A0A6V7PJN6_ANACO|nr:unnamed protein product [Ananas comosus var. bracteatus]
MDDTVLDKLRQGDEIFIRGLISPESEDHSAINVGGADQAGRSSWRGVTAGGNSALHIVATFGHLELAKLICGRDRSLLAARNAAREMPLHCAVRAGADQIVSHFILEARRWEDGRRLEDVLRATDKEGKTALHAAAEEGHAAVARVLVSADPGLAALVDNTGASPLYAAVLSKSLEVVQILIELESPAEGGIQAGTTSAGATQKISYAGPNGQTALHAAAIVQSPGSYLTCQSASSSPILHE